MARRLAIASVLALLAAGGASGQSADQRIQALDEKIANLRGKIASAEQREGVLTSEISAVTAKIRALEDDVDSASARLAVLEDELTVYKNRLARLTQIFQLQTERLELLRRQYEIAERRLNGRIVAIYQADEPDAVAVVLSARSLGELLDQLDYVDQVSQQDRSIAFQVADAKEQMRVARAETGRTRARVADTTRAVEERTDAQRAERYRLLASQQALDGARQDKQQTLAAVQTSKEEFLHEVAGLQQTSRALAARIQASQGSALLTPDGSHAVSASGFIWPVSGPVTSGFGWRWGRMHEGIDIGAGSGTPIGAAASGTVIFAGWMGGYGQLVVVDHGGGLATAYAHMSSMASGVGQQVVQGQTLGYVGCTGHCFGSHLHFEVRVNGSPVDPLGYL